MHKLMPKSSIYQLSYLVTEDTFKLLVSLSENYV